jgi:hypothetical protein
VKHLLFGFLAAALILTAAPLGAQQKPNFSGNWKINQVKSNFGDVPAPDAFTRKIVHAEPSISIDEVQSSPAGEQATQRKMTTDGKESTFSASGADIKATAKWEGNALVIVSSVPAIGIAYNDRMTLSPDGKLLTSVVRLDTPQGAFELTVVFDKQ